MWKIYLFSLFLLTASSCGNSKDHPEQIDKLKSILVETNPAASNPMESSAVLGEMVRLDFHFLAPLGTTLTNPRLVAPSASTRALPFNGLVVSGVDSQTYPGVQHFIVHAEGQLPSLASFGDLIDPIKAEGSVPLAYQLLVFDGSRDISVIGDFPAFVDRTRAESRANFADTSITKPASDGAAAGKEFDIAASYSNPRDEAIKISWFASGDAEITNRRALDTTLKLKNETSYTLIFTVRGQKSRASAIRFRSISL